MEVLRRQRSGRREARSDDRVEGLTPYELWRRPILPLSDDEEVTISVKQLNTEFKCPVCLGILHDTQAIMECLHRFCSECISKSLRLSKKECPSCRVKCPSRRSLRGDSNFDSIIRKIYPNLEDYEAKEEERLNQIQKMYNTEDFAHRHEEGLKRQSMSKRPRTKRTRPTAERADQKAEEPPAKRPAEGRESESSKRDISTRQEASSSRASQSRDADSPIDEDADSFEDDGFNDDRDSDFDYESFVHPTRRKSGSQSLEPDGKELRSPRGDLRRDFADSLMRVKDKDFDDVEFLLVAHPNEKNLPLLEGKFLKTSSKCSVQHLCKYLDVKLNPTGQNTLDYQVTLSKRGRTLILPKYLTLSDIMKHYWKTKSDLILHYSLEGTDLHDA